MRAKGKLYRLRATPAVNKDEQLTSVGSSTRQYEIASPDDQEEIYKSSDAYKAQQKRLRRKVKK